MGCRVWIRIVMRRLFCSRERGGEMLLYVTEKETRNSLSFLTFIERLVIYFFFQYNRHEVFGSISLERHTCLSASSFTHRSFRTRRRTTFTPLNASLPYTSPPSLPGYSILDSGEDLWLSFTPPSLPLPPQLLHRPTR